MGMKIHNLVIAGLVLLLLVGFLYWSNHHKPDDSSKISADTPPAILKLDQGSITKLELKKKDTQPIQLEKANSGDWQITQPKPLRADESAVSGMLSTLSSLNSERLVEDKASALKTYGLEQPSLEVDLIERGNKSQQLLLGDDTPTGGGLYVMRAGDPRIFTVSSYVKTSVDKNLNDLRDKRLLIVNVDKVSRIELIRKGEDIEFGRNKDDWQILKPKPLRADSIQVGDLLRELAEAKMDLSAPEAKDAASTFAHAAPLATVDITDDRGTQQLQIRESKDKNQKEAFYAKSTLVEGAYKVDSALGKALDRSVDEFRNKKLFDFSYTDPNKVELHNGDKSYFLTRGTGGSEDWWSNGKKVDGASGEAVISDLRELTATKFVESGFSNPIIEASVVSDDGKRTEKVQIAKSGDQYIAKRENEPGLYQLDSKSVEALLKAADAIQPATIQAGQNRR